MGLQQLIHLDDNLRQKYDADLAQVETLVRETHKELENVKDRVTRLEHEVRHDLCRLEVRQLKLEAAQSKLSETVEDTFPQGTANVLPYIGLMVSSI